MSGATYPVTVVSVWLVGLLFAYLSVNSHTKFQKFHQMSKNQNENMFHTILSNFDFWSRLFHTITTKNEKTPDLAWHTLGLNFSPQILVQISEVSFKFFSRFFFLLLVKMYPTSTIRPSKFKIIWTKMHCRGLLPYLWPFTDFKNFIRFQNFLNQNVF